MSPSKLSLQKIWLILFVCAVGLIACDTSSVLSQLSPTAVLTQEAQISQPEATATALSIKATVVTTQTVTPSAPPAPIATSAPRATVVAQQSVSPRTPTVLARATSTPTKSPSVVIVSTATRTSTPKAQTGCIANSPQAKPSGIISSVTLGTKRDQNAALVPASVFATNATIYAVVVTQNAPATAIIKAEWYATDVGSAAPCNTFIDRAELSADPNIDFTLVPSSKWPTGTYRVEIYVNGTLDRAVNFSVK